MSSERPSQRLLFLLLATPTILGTGWRITRLDRKLGFGDLLAALRARSAKPLPRRLAHPERLAGAVERLLPFVPPRSYGTCLRRCLLLLELWSRCGLDPRLHVGIHTQRPELDGHAWLTAESANGEPLQVSGPRETTTAFEL